VDRQIDRQTNEVKGTISSAEIANGRWPPPAASSCLQTRREHLTEQFFMRNVLNEKSSLHYLLSNKRDVNIVNTQKHLNYHKLELKDSKHRSSHTVLHISNSIYGRYTLFNRLYLFLHEHCIFSIISIVDNPADAATPNEPHLLL